MNRFGLVGVLVVVCACGGESEKKAPDIPSAQKQQQAKGQQQPAAQAPVDDGARKAKLEELRARKEALVTKRKLLDADLKQLETRHAEEKETAKGISRLRKRWPALRRDAMTSAARMRRMLKRKAELEKYADSAAAGNLKKLREERKAIDKRYQDALGGRRKAIADANRGAVEESPVKRDLDTVRAMKIKWFETTPTARRGKVGSGERSKINSTFRSWLSSEQKRGDVATKVLTQPLAPKGKTQKNYDFTNLDFYVLMELLENELDKKNIVAEKKELKQKEKVVNAVEVELDAIDLKINEELLQGGDELQEFENLMSRLPDAMTLNDTLQLQAAAYSGILAEYRSMRDRHEKEFAAANGAIEAVNAELKKLKTQSRGLGG